MVTSLTYDENQKELHMIDSLVKELAAYVSEEDWKLLKASMPKQLDELTEGNPILDFLVYDIRNREGLSKLKEIKHEYKETELCIITDTSISPMEYMRPDIMASSLVLRPFSEEQAKEILKEFLQNAFDKRGNSEQRKTSFFVESREGKIQVPYDKILYFEARNKKVYVCTNKEEYGFYTTIDKLEEMLPESFIRCHRGFIVNSSKIRKVLISQNIIYLTDDFDVPLSRSYKSVLKDFCK